MLSETYLSEFDRTNLFMKDVSDISSAVSSFFKVVLRWDDTISRLFAIFTIGDNFCDFLFVHCMKFPFWKGVNSIRKEFAPRGSKFFPLRVDHFSEGDKNKLDRVASPESVSIPLKNIITLKDGGAILLQWKSQLNFLSVIFIVFTLNIRTILH